MEEAEYRVGQGYDVHRLVAGRRLILGGVDIPHEQGLLGHSDADVLTHAVADALLGAVALGDIGTHFPDTEERWRGVSSLALLREIAALLRAEGWRPVNVDATVVAQRPRLRPYVAAMCTNLAHTLGVPGDRVNVKATTTEGLGLTGRGEGIAAQAVALVRRDPGAEQEV